MLDEFAKYAIQKLITKNPGINGEGEWERCHTHI